jgi:hypothetical protein
MIAALGLLEAKNATDQLAGSLFVKGLSGNRLAGRKWKSSEVLDFKKSYTQMLWTALRTKAAYLPG